MAVYLLFVIFIIINNHIGYCHTIIPNENVSNKTNIGVI